MLNASLISGLLELYLRGISDQLITLKHHTGKGGRRNTVVAFTLHALPARVRITATEFIQKTSDVAVLIDS